MLLGHLYKTLSMDTKRVLILTYYWPPSGGAGVQRWLKFCRYLPQYGVEPVVITVDPKVASYPLLDESLLAEVPEDMQVIRTRSFEPLALLGRIVGKKQVPHAGFSNVDTRSLLQRVLRFIRGNFFVPDARVGWNRYAYKAARKLIEQKSFDAIVTTGPPHSTHLVGLRLKKKLGIKWLADFRDPWTDIYYYNQLMHLPFVKQYDAKLERNVLAAADEVVTVGNTLRKQLEKKLNSREVKVVSNGFDPVDFNDFSVQKPKVFTVTYMGTISEQYNPDVFIEACKILKDKGVDFCIRFVGQVASPVLKKFTNAGLDGHLELISYVAHHEALQYLSRSSALLLVLPDIPGNKGILTGKMFEYLASGLPIIGIGPTDSDAAFLIKEAGAGRMFEQGSGFQLLSYLRELQVDGGVDFSTKSGEIYSRDILAKEIAGIL